MAQPASPSDTFMRGDNEVVVIKITSDSAGLVPVDITGRSYVYSIATAPGATVTTSATGVVVGASGQVTFTFPNAKTVLLTGTQYAYDVVETASGLESTIILASLQVLTGVTP